MKRLVADLIRDLDVHRRNTGKVFRVHDAVGRTVAEVVEGKSTIRVNFSDPTPGTDGKSEAWPGGGIRVNANNFEHVRGLIVGATRNVPLVAGPSNTVQDAITILEAAAREGTLDVVLDAGMTRLLAQRHLAAIGAESDEPTAHEREEVPQTRRRRARTTS